MAQRDQIKAKTVIQSHSLELILTLHESADTITKKKIRIQNINRYKIVFITFPTVFNTVGLDVSETIAGKRNCLIFSIIFDILFFLFILSPFLKIVLWISKKT